MYERRNTDRKLTDWLNDSACCGYFPAFLLSMHVLQKSSVSFPVKCNYTLLHELLYKTIYCWNAPSNKYICRISTENWWRNYQTDISKRRKKKKLGTDSHHYIWHKCISQKDVTWPTVTGFIQLTHDTDKPVSFSQWRLVYIIHEGNSRKWISFHAPPLPVLLELDNKDRVL